MNHCRFPGSAHKEVVCHCFPPDLPGVHFLIYHGLTTYTGAIITIETTNLAVVVSYWTGRVSTTLSMFPPWISDIS